jgi:hypothetical protein
MGYDRKNHRTPGTLRSLLQYGWLLGLAAVLLLSAGCGGDGSTSAESGADTLGVEALAAKEPRASLKLLDATADMAQTGETDWTLDKTGSVNRTEGTVTWEITATEIAAEAGLLVVSGQMTVENTGSGPAPIGNIVVNLQARAGSTWITLSSVIADATNGDDATTANILAQASSEGLSFFVENAASGALQLTDASTGEPLSLVPQFAIPAGGLLPLQFSAIFDNDILNLPAGTATRAEVIVSFGNAAPGNASGSDIDINGNGVIDEEEARVRSVPTRHGLTVPPQPDGIVTLSDTLDDITTTGTVTFWDAMFDLGETSGTVSVNYDGGTEGGTITNCAHLTGTGVDLEACDTQMIGGDGCIPGTPGCAWETGNLRTYTQFDWPESGSTLVSTNFLSVYGGIFEVGIPGTAGFSIVFTTGANLLAFLPETGANGVLTSDLLNPTTSPAGAFGGNVVALKLNVDFSDRGIIAGTADVAFGDLLVCGVQGVDGLSVRQVLGLANTHLGGGSTPISTNDLAAILVDLNRAFLNTIPSTFAQNHLVNGACPDSP